MLQIETYTLEMIVKTMIEPKGNFEFTLQTFMGHVILSLANSQTSMFGISAGNCIRNPEPESIENLKQYTIVAREEVICATA